MMPITTQQTNRTDFREMLSGKAMSENIVVSFQRLLPTFHDRIFIRRNHSAIRPHCGRILWENAVDEDAIFETGFVDIGV